MPFSLLNGLSSMGQSLSQTAGQMGLLTEKMDLERQGQILANDLATQRETGLATQQQAAAKALQESSQAFQAGQQQSTQAFQTAQQQRQETFQAGQQANLIAANRANELMRLRAPSDQMKLLQAIGVLPPTDYNELAGGGAGTGGTPTDGGNTYTSPPPASPGVKPAPSTPAATPTAPTAPATSTTAPVTSAAPLTTPGGLAMTPVVRKLIGYAPIGSDEDIRMNLMADIQKDPQFANKTPGEQGAELESRLAIAKGTMTDPATRHLMAQAIANYQMPSLSGFSLSKPGGAETMGEVMKINPDFQAERFPTVQTAMKDFSTGPDGQKIGSANSLIQHFDAFLLTARMLNDGTLTSFPYLRQLQNWYQDNVGMPLPKTMAALSEIVSLETMKAISGGIGSKDDRDRIVKSLTPSGSLDQIESVVNAYKTLMLGQLRSLKTRYEDATPNTPIYRGTGEFSFAHKLEPATLSSLGMTGGELTNAEPLPAEVRNAVTGAPATPPATGIKRFWTPPHTTAVRPQQAQIQPQAQP